MGQEKYKNGFHVTTHLDVLGDPSRWKKPRRVFVCSMGDLFHEDVPFSFINLVFRAMHACQQHTFQVLTKRPHRLREFLKEQVRPEALPLESIWMGVSVENNDQTWRIRELLRCSAVVRFVSCEPLLGSPYLEPFMDRIDWVIVGGESGPRARPIDPNGVRRIRDECTRTRTPFMFKQWGGPNKKAAGRKLDGKIWDQYPFPK
jgi:protein gp37